MAYRNVERAFGHEMTVSINVETVIRRPKVIAAIFSEAIWQAVLNIFSFFLFIFDISLKLWHL